MIYCVSLSIAYTLYQLNYENYDDGDGDGDGDDDGDGDGLVTCNLDGSCIYNGE